MLRFRANTELIETDDFVGTVCDLFRQERLGVAGLVFDPNIGARDDLERLEAELAGLRVATERYAFPGGEPTTDMVDSATAFFRPAKPAILIGIGGGSTLDLTKAVSVMCNAEGGVADYHGTGKRPPTSIRKILIPTTAGTGSEVTPGAVLVNRETAFKRALEVPAGRANVAVLDAHLTVSQPEAVTIFTGMDALAHAIESFTARNANFVTRMYSREAFRLVANNLPRVVRDPMDISARRATLLGSCLAGFAIFNSNTGACHALAYPMGIYHKVPHGLAVARILPKVTEINIGKGCTQYSDLLPLIEGSPCSGVPQADAAEFGEWLKSYEPLRRLKPTLGEYGVVKDGIGFLAERGLDLVSALSNNPVGFGKDDAVRVLEGLAVE